MNLLNLYKIVSDLNGFIIEGKTHQVIKKLEELKSKGVDASKFDYKSLYENNDLLPPISVAILFNRRDVINKLLGDYNFDANLVYDDEDGYTILKDAIFRGDYDIVKTLLDYGADPNLKNKNDENYLYYSVGAYSRLRNDYYSVIKLLIDKKADVNNVSKKSNLSVVGLFLKNFNKIYHDSKKMALKTFELFFDLINNDDVVIEDTPTNKKDYMFKLIDNIFDNVPLIEFKKLLKNKEIKTKNNIEFIKYILIKI